MHRWLALLFVPSLSCGGIVVDDRGESPTEPAACPLTEPVRGASCSMPPHIACYYFPQVPPPTYDIADELSCSDGHWQGGPEGLFGRSRCGEGERCVFFHEKSACTIECTQRCECDAATNELVCRSTPCP
jgi:hypothetical protein